MTVRASASAAELTHVAAQVRGSWLGLFGCLTTAIRFVCTLLLEEEADEAREDHAEAERHAREDHVEECVVFVAVAIPLLAVDAGANTKAGSRIGGAAGCGLCRAGIRRVARRGRGAVGSGGPHPRGRGGARWATRRFLQP